MEPTSPDAVAPPGSFCGLCGQAVPAGDGLFKLPANRTGASGGPLVCWTCRWAPETHDVDEAFLSTKVRYRLAHRPTYTPTHDECFVWANLLGLIALENEQEFHDAEVMNRGADGGRCPIFGYDGMRRLVSYLERYAEDLAAEES